MKTLLSTALLLLISSLSAAVPLRWTVETSRLQPAQFEGYHGETIDFAATMQTYGKPLAITNDLIGIYWQTNGMGSAYWTAPAVLSNNVITARWTPSMDVGANVYSCFIGAPGEIYRAAFQLRLRPSPGAVPSQLPLPVKTLDFAQVTVLNAPYYSKSETDAKIIELAPAPGNYATVSNRAMTAVSSEIDVGPSGNPTPILRPMKPGLGGRLYGDKLAVSWSSGEVLYGILSDITGFSPFLTSFTESDPNVPSWAKEALKPSYSWSEIESKPTFAAVATSGAYSDLTGKPSIPTDSTVAGWGYIKSWTETDPTVPAWAKTTSKPTYTWTEISNKPSWIGSTKPSYTWSEIGSKPTTFTPSAHSHASDSWFTGALSGKLDQIGSSDLHLDGGASIYFDGEEWMARVDSVVSQYSWDWSSIYNTPETLGGYGITDAYTIAQVDNMLNAKSDKFNVNGLAPANGNVDVKEIFNSNKTKKIDGNGDVYVGEVNTGGSWRHTNGAVMSYYDNSGSVYTWRTVDGRQSVSYNSANGNVTVTGNYYGTIRSGLNPLNGDDLGAVTSGVNIVTFTKQQTQFPDEPTTRFATLDDIPTALKCPNSLTINVNGALEATYDGSAARTVNITTGGGAPGATVASAALEYHADGQAISVSVAAAGTLTAVVDNWTDGQSQMAFVTLAAGASIAPAIKLIGYSEWPIGEEFMAVCTKRGSKIYVNPVCITEE